MIVDHTDPNDTDKISCAKNIQKNYIYDNIYGLINQTGLYNINKVVRFVFCDLYNRSDLPT